MLIPQSAAPGTYKGALLVKDGSRLLQQLNLEIVVSSRELPGTVRMGLSSGFVAESVCCCPLLSGSLCGVREHLDAMRPLMKMLADAGQKIITATLTHKPWNGQTEDYF